MYKKKNALYPPPEGRGITAQKVKQAKRKLLPKGTTQALRNARKKSTLNGQKMLRSTQGWQETRTKGKQCLLEATDVVKEFVEYARDNGSGNADRYFTVIAKLKNKALFTWKGKIKDLRQWMSEKQLDDIKTADNIVARSLSRDMAAGIEYHQIKINAQMRATEFGHAIGKSVIASEQLELELL